MVYVASQIRGIETTKLQELGSETNSSTSIEGTFFETELIRISLAILDLYSRRK